MTHDAVVLVHRADGWATVELHRPHRRNATTGPMMDALAAALHELSADESVAAIVLRGAGGAFCSGVDLTELQADPPPPWRETFGASGETAHRALWNCACPIVVALERFAINAGSSLALSGDLIVAGEGAFLQVGEIRQGAPIPMNAAWLGVRATSTVANRLAYLGDRVPAPELHRLGLVTEIVADDGVVARAEAIAAEVASHPVGSARRIKASLRERVDLDPTRWFAGTGGGALLAAPRLDR